jgi:methylated-DNA-protein-cysteine methyltransferase-like protein
MQQLLESEGIEVLDNQIVDFDKVFWEPEVNL